MNDPNTSLTRRRKPLGQPPEAAARTDKGSTLVEILISMVLIGTVVVSMMAALRSSIQASGVVFDAAKVETILLNAGDRVARAPQLCEYEQYVDAAALAEGWPLNATSVVVDRLDVATGTWSTQNCPDDVGPFDVQRMTITASDPDGKITRTLTVVKSNVD